MEFELEKIQLDLKVTWKISRNASQSKTNYILKLGEYESEIAPNVRYQETPELIEKHFKELNKVTKMQFHWCSSFQTAVNNVLLKRDHKGDLEKALQLPKVENVPTSFSIPIMELDEVENYLKENAEYQVYKLKVADSKSLDLLKEVVKHTDKPIRVDANEGFKSLDDYLAFEKEIQGFNIQFIEQPFATDMVETYKLLKPKSKFEIIADESLLLDFHGPKFQEMFHGINVKNMKGRGLENCKKQLEKAKAFGLKTMVGCMIESSLGISEALHLASLCDYVDLDGSLLVSNDPYKHLLKVKDGCLSFAD
ncbi:MAG: hypothetical protein CME62_17365 [Halobacteriovoraceae bacterium]|nr:hypothetical protein [Halobacteriovoraceae bacterium]|tara:strand:- start:11451 stop:12377 length:927 start_codon:yes stop_codon:yes gene_type:complete